MKIKYLGTAAAEGIPALFCDCELCQKARLEKGKNIRTRSQMLVNDDLLIDYPPDSFYHFVNYQIDHSKIHHLLISHHHEDHFYPSDFEYFISGFSTIKKAIPFTIYGSIDMQEDLSSFLKHERNQGLHFKELKPYVTYQIGNYFVTPLEASHGTEHPLIYIVSDGKKELLYCHDSGPLKDEVFNYFAKSNHHIDLISIDCTAGDNDIDWTCHMNVRMNIDTVNRLKECGVMDETSKVVLNHFSHNGGHVLYEDMTKIADKLGFIVSYDGLEIEL